MDPLTQLSQLRRSVVQTTEILSKFQEMNQAVQRLTQTLARQQAEPLGSAPDLLALHYEVSKWETFRNETLHLAGTSAPETRQQLISMLAPLEALLDAFEAYMLELFALVPDLARRGQGSVVVRLAKIMERETRADERTAAIRLAKHAKIEGAARFRAMATYGHTIKLYWHKFRHMVRASTLQRLQKAWEALPEPGPRALLESIDWLYQDLDFVRRAVVPLFPSDVHVYRMYVQAHHRALGDLFQAHVPLDTADAASLLELYHVAHEHQSRLLDADHGIEAAWLEPTLLGGQEQTIMEDYASLLTRKLDDWTATLMHDEITAFVQRERAPDETNEGMYQLSGYVILFQMLNQQVDMASQTGHGDLLVRVIDHACVVMHNNQASWLRIVQQEFKKQTTAKNADEVKGGLVEYLMALANDQLASADQAEVLMHRLEPMVPAEHRAHVREVLDNTLNGFLDISKHCVQMLVELVLFDLRPAFKDLFTYPAWYMEGTTTMITETVRDYASDYAARLEPNLYDVLSDDLITRLLTAYLTTLRRAARLRMPKAAERFRTDISELQNLITSVRSADEAKSRTEVLHMLHAILGAAPSMVFLPYWNFAKAHGPHLAFFEALLKARDDMDKAEVVSVMDSARRKVQQEQLPEVPEGGATIMSAVSQTSTSGLSGLLAGWHAGPDSVAWGALAQSAQNYLGAAGWRRDA